VDDPRYPQGNEANVFARDMLFSHEVWEEVGEDLFEAQDERPLLDISERILSIRSPDAASALLASVLWMPIIHVSPLWWDKKKSANN